MEYVALLRGINVGGNNKVVMSELREQVAAEGFANVRTYTVATSSSRLRLRLMSRVTRWRRQSNTSWRAATTSRFALPS